MCEKQKKQKQVKSSLCHQLVIVLITQKQNDNIFSNQLKDASHLPLNKTYYLSSFCTRGNGHRRDDATPNEADSNLGHTVMNS